MTEFLNALKADLLDRRLLPILALVGVALLAASAYAVLGGGGSTATTASTATRPVSTGASGIAVSPAPANPNEAVAETTSGASHQRGGVSRNPFTPLPGTKSTTASTSKSTTGSGSSTTSTTSGSGSSSKGAGGTTPTPTPKPAPAKPQPKVVYHVAVLFGGVPAGTSSPSSQLTPYEDLKLLTPLPSSTQPLIVFRGVVAGGKSATFTLVGEAILHGEGSCLPNASQCQAIDLRPGQAEQLEYLPASGPATLYELKIVSISSSKASAAKAARIFHAESKAGRELLRRAGLTALPWLHYLASKGVLVFAGHQAFAARAHAAAGRAYHKR
jgi:hypothetical protein